MSKWRKYLIGTWSWKRPLYSILSIYIILLIIVLFFADKLIFPAPENTYDKTLENLILLENESGQQVASLYIKGSPDLPTLLWSHGNAEDLLSLTPLLQHIRDNQGYNILAYDYPGYGLSDGKPSENGCYENITAAWVYLTDKLSVPQDKIIIVGQSVGTGPSTWLASREQIKPAGLVLIAPFKSINRVPFGVNIFPKDRFPNINRIENVSAPLLVIHGKKDAMIKPSHGKAIHEAHTGDKSLMIIENVNHNDVWGSDEVYQSLYKFIDKNNKQ